MKPPSFWYKKPRAWAGAWAWLLSPLACLYTCASAVRLRRSPRAKLNIPVICVGNVNLGGSGKTPSVIYIAQILADKGKAVHILSRGYGGRLRGPILVSAKSSAKDVGDEPLLLCEFAPTWVAKDRAAGAIAAQNAGAEVIIMDDGLQNPSVKKDLSLLVVDGGLGFGNGCVFPAGPLREPIDTALTRTDGVIIIGDKTAICRTHPQLKTMTDFVAKGQIQVLPTGMDWQGLRCLAFAGIAHPQKFFQTLRGTGAVIVESIGFADHQVFSAPLLRRLAKRATALDATLLCTEKDKVRMERAWQDKVMSLPVRLDIKDSAALIAALDGLF